MAVRVERHINNAYDRRRCCRGGVQVTDYPATRKTGPSKDAR